jgi:4-amino-4-deoxy-L-arabinose transferase-like glycosyltransferase
MKASRIRRDHLVLAAIILAALGLRVSYLASDPLPSLINATEGEVAHNIVAHGRWFELEEDVATAAARYVGDMQALPDPGVYNKVHGNHVLRPEIVQPIGSALLLAGLWQFTTGEHYLPLQILQVIVDSLTVLLIYWIAMRLFDRKPAALIAAALYAIYPGIAQEARDPYVDIWGVEFTVLILALFLKATASPHRWRWWVCCGLATGLGCYFRPNVVILAPILLFVTIPSTGWSETLRRLAVIVAVTTTILMPWIVRNYAEFHAFVPTTSGLGETLWEGMGEMHNDFGAYWDKEAITTAEVHQSAPNARPQTPAFDSVLLHRAISTIPHHLGFYLKILAYRAAQTVWLYEPEWMHSRAMTPFGDKAGILHFARTHPLNLVEDALDPAIFVTAMLSLILTWKSYRREHVLLIATVLAVLVPYIILLVQARYILPAEFVYLILIGLGVDRLAQLLRRRHRTRKLSPSEMSLALD